MLGAYVVWRASGRGLLLGLKEHLSKAIFGSPDFGLQYWKTILSITYQLIG